MKVPCRECERQLEGFYTCDGFKVGCHYCEIEYEKFECPCCHQIVDPRALQEHHVTPTKTEFICANCHSIITHEQNWPVVKGKEGWRWARGICHKCYDERRRKVRGVKTGENWSFKGSVYEKYRCPACGHEFVG